MIVFSFEWPALLNLLASVIFPLLVGFVTTRETDRGRKAIYLAALAWGTQLATELAVALSQHVAYDLGQALFAGLGSFLIAVGLHYGFWQPTGVTAKVADSGVQGRHEAEPPVAG